MVGITGGIGSARRGGAVVREGAVVRGGGGAAFSGQNRLGSGATGAGAARTAGAGAAFSGQGRLRGRPRSVERRLNDFQAAMKPRRRLAEREKPGYRGRRALGAPHKHHPRGDGIRPHAPAFQESPDPQYTKLRFPGQRQRYAVERLGR